MKVLAVNGSPRKNWNTAMLLDSALDGAKSAGAAGRRVDLYELDYKGCTSCFGCKLLGGPSFGRCAMRDDLTEILEEAIDSDILLLGSPIYFNDVTGEMRSFLERLYFPDITYNKSREQLYPKKRQVGWFFTTNAPAGTYAKFYPEVCATSERLLGHTEYVDASETLQFTDYSLYAADMFDVPARKERREKVFPEDRKKAFELGKKLAELSRNTGAAAK
jgi:multimeric flavodoxin WrbA